jgi:hypothetical protein
MTLNIVNKNIVLTNFLDGKYGLFNGLSYDLPHARNNKLIQPWTKIKKGHLSVLLYHNKKNNPNTQKTYSGGVKPMARK